MSNAVLNETLNQTVELPTPNTVDVHVVDAENGIYYVNLPLNMIKFVITGARLYGDGTIELDTVFNGEATTLCYYEGEIVCSSSMPMIEGFPNL